MKSIGGRKYYRRGYREVLLGLKNEDEIKENSFLKGVLVSLILFHAKAIFPRKAYWTLVNETGQYFGGNEIFVNDLAFIEKSRIPDPTSTGNNDAPPRFIVEVDLKVDPTDYGNALSTGSELAYMVEKSRKLIDFGVEGVAWVLTESRKILLMRPNRRLEVFEWTEEVPIFGEYSFCLQTIMEELGIVPPSE